jgi:hypothetical protein
MKLNARFDGRNLVPEQVPDLPRDRLLHISIEMTAGHEHHSRVDFQNWLGQAKQSPENLSPRFKNSDQLWEKG